jgi:tRNA dimethylallyltransferase
LKNQLIAVVGPTGIGKSRYAVLLAENFNGEIVNADSRQVYRYMDIGTAKPTVAEQATVHHHLIDIIAPDQDFSLAEYQQLANKAIVDIQSRGKLPFLVGGTGQYIKAVLEGWEIPEVAPDTHFRHELEKQAENGQAAELYQELVRVDPAAAEKIDPRNIRRVIRALEVTRMTGIAFSQQQKKLAPPYVTITIGLTARRTELYRRVDARVDKMIADGLTAEVRKLLDAGYNLDLPAMSSIGYRQMGSFLKGDMTLSAAVENIKVETHRFIRHQYNWFRLTDEKISWFDMTEYDIENRLIKAAGDFLIRTRE